MPEEKIKEALLAIFRDLEMPPSTFSGHTLQRTLDAVDLPVLEKMIAGLGQRLEEVSQAAEQALQLCAGPEAELWQKKVKEAAQEWQLIARLEALHRFRERLEGTFTEKEGKAIFASVIALAMMGFRGQMGEAGVEVAQLLGSGEGEVAGAIGRLSRVLLSGKTEVLEAAGRGMERKEQVIEVIEGLAQVAKGLELCGNIVVVGGGGQDYGGLWERLLGKEGGHGPEDRSHLGED